MFHSCDSLPRICQVFRSYRRDYIYWRLTYRCTRNRYRPSVNRLGSSLQLNTLMLMGYEPNKTLS